MNDLRRWALLLALVAGASCRHAPVASCVSSCERDEARCIQEGHSSFERSWECSKAKDKCVEACPKT